jgi:hypothetical protein
MKVLEEEKGEEGEGEGWMKNLGYTAGTAKTLDNSSDRYLPSI